MNSDPRKTTMARASSIYKRQTRPLVRDRTPQKQDRNCKRAINIWSWAPDGARHQDLLIDWPSVAMWLWLLSYPPTRVEAGSNTSTVTLRVVGGDEKGSLKSETVKYDHESQGNLTREGLRWWGPAAYRKDRPVLSSERAPHKNKTVTVKE
jgi:hypothetical protein